jgi:tyrosine-protein phosphatase 2/3
MREITQLHYSQWPDFGAPADPRHLLGLIEQTNKYAQRTSGSPTTSSFRQKAADRSRKWVVHCSAGCGRTGTFCTIDSVIEMLKRQRTLRRLQAHEDAMDIDSEGDWLRRDDVDLIAKTVEDFRLQRLSMVQNLRQFVLCYEAVLQWVVDEQASS